MKTIRSCQNIFKRLAHSAGVSKKTTAQTSTINEVKGLSSKCVKPVSEPVGPGASPISEYKVPEYFCFNRFSYAEAEVEMAKYRCPQPSAVKKI